MAVDGRLDLKLSAADKQLLAQAAAIEGASAVFEEQQLAPMRHDRKAFSCGEEALDRFLRQQAHRNMRRALFWDGTTGP